MELKQITFDKNNLRFNVELQRTGGYYIDIQYTEDNGESWENVGHFRTDEVSSDDLIEGLEFFKNYNFIQEK